MNIVTYNSINKNLSSELEKKGWNVSNSMNNNTNILIYDSDINKLAEIMKQTSNSNKILIINSKDKENEEIIEDIERKTYEKLF